MELIPAFILIFALYVLSSKISGSYINGLSYITATMLVVILFSTIYLLTNGYSQGPYIITRSSLATVDLFYVVSYFSIFLGYISGWSRPLRINIKFSPKKKNIYLFLLISFLMITGYILFVFNDFGMEIITNSRKIYTQTRLGFGHLYFSSMFLITVSLITVLFQGGPVKILFIILGFIYAYLSGAKSILVSFIYIFFFYYLFRKGLRVNFLKLLALVLAGFVLLIGVFYIFSPLARGHIFEFMVNYSDQIRNFAVEIGNLNTVQRGKLWFEDNFYAFIPRAFFPNKPELFGTFKLSYRFYPDGTMKFSGAPSFGPFGTLFADFGYISVYLITVIFFIKGYLVGMFEKRVRAEGGMDMLNFFMFILLSFGYFLNVGISALSLFLLNIVLVILILYAYSIRLNFRGDRIDAA